MWVVFDKDDYSDEQFNKAIKTSEYNVAWSNPNFELWILSHFMKVSRYVSKDDVMKSIIHKFIHGMEIQLQMQMPMLLFKMEKLLEKPKLA